MAKKPWPFETLGLGVKRLDGGMGLATAGRSTTTITCYQTTQRLGSRLWLKATSLVKPSRGVWASGFRLRGKGSSTDWNTTNLQNSEIGGFRSSA